MASRRSPEDEAKRLGLEVVRRREELGLTQEKLASKAGISRNQLQLIEQGLSDRKSRRPGNPRLASLVGLSRELGFQISIDGSRVSGYVIEFGDASDE